MKNKIISLILLFISFISYKYIYAQPLPPKPAYPLGIKQIHSGHSLTDPLFYPHWPGQFVNLMAQVQGLQGWQLFDVTIGKSTIPGSSIKQRWENPPGFNSPDAKNDIGNWEVLCMTERVPLFYEGGNSQDWYLQGIQEQREYLSLFANHAWNNGNNGNGAPTLLWTTWTAIDNSNGPWREMLDIQGEEFERMQDYANDNRPAGAPPVYLIPGHKMMARLYDDIQAGLVPGVSNISEFFSDNIHTNELGAYAMAMIHYACLFNTNPSGLPVDLLPNAPTGTPKPSQELASYLQQMIWEVVTQYPRTGIYVNTSATTETVDNIILFPNPASEYLYLFDLNKTIASDLCYQVFDFSGRLQLSDCGTIISLNSLAPGTYLLFTQGIWKTFSKH